MSDKEEEIIVKRFAHKGKKYLINPDSLDVFDEKSHNILGVYDKEKDAIVPNEQFITITVKREKRANKKATEMKRKEEEAKKLKDMEEQKRMEEDKPERFYYTVKTGRVVPFTYSGKEESIFGYKTPKTNRAYTALFQPLGMYDTETRKVDFSKKPPQLEGYEEDSEEEDLDWLIDKLDAEIDELD